MVNYSWKLASFRGYLKYFGRCTRSIVHYSDAPRLVALAVVLIVTCPEVVLYIPTKSPEKPFHVGHGHRSRPHISYKCYIMALRTLLQGPMQGLMHPRYSANYKAARAWHISFCCANGLASRQHIALRKHVVKRVICAGSFRSYLLFHIPVFSTVGGGCSGVHLPKEL